MRPLSKSLNGSQVSIEPTPIILNILRTIARLVLGARVGLWWHYFPPRSRVGAT